MSTLEYIDPRLAGIILGIALVVGALTYDQVAKWKTNRSQRRSNQQRRQLKDREQQTRLNAKSRL